MNYLQRTFFLGLILTFLLIFGTCIAGATASPKIEWMKSFGGSDSDYSTAIIQTTDGGYLITGFTYSNNGDFTSNHGESEVYIIKVTSSGEIEWQKTLGGSEDDMSHSIIQTVDGGYIFTGYTGSNNGDITNNHGISDVLVVKLSSTGSTEWQKTYGGTNRDWGEEIIETSDGGYILTGLTESNDGDVTGSHGAQDLWLVKLDNSGGIEWQKAFGGSSYDWGNSIVQTIEGGYILAGGTQSSDGDVTEKHGTSDIWIVKLDESGGIEWQKTLGGTSEEHVNSIIQTSDMGYILTGGSKSIDGDLTKIIGSGYDVWVVKLSASGNIEWQKALGGSDSQRDQRVRRMYEEGSSIIQTARRLCSDRRCSFR